MIKTRFESLTNSGPALALVAVLSWGAMFPIAAHALPHVNAIDLTAARYGIAVPIFLAILVLAEGRRALHPQGRGVRLWVQGTVGFAGFNLLSYIGLQHTGPRNAALIVAAMPLTTAAYRFARDGVRPARGTVALAFVALAGVLLVLSRGQLSTLTAGGVGWGAGLVALGMTGWVAYTVGADRFPGWSPLRYTALSATAGTVSIVVIAQVATLAGWIATPTGSDWAAVAPELAFIVLAGAVAAVLAWNTAMRRIGPARGVLFINLVPLTSFAISIAGGYRPNGHEIAGALVTIAALIAAQSVASGSPAPASRRWSRTARRPSARSRSRSSAGACRSAAAAAAGSAGTAVASASAPASSS